MIPLRKPPALIEYEKRTRLAEEARALPDDVLSRSYRAYCEAQLARAEARLADAT